MRWNWIILAVLVFIYLLRPNLLAGLFIWPIWVFLSPLALWSLISLRKAKIRSNIAFLVVLLFVWGWLGDELVPILRQFQPKPQFDLVTYVVVSVNCAGGDPKVLESAIGENAPLAVLIQERPDTSFLLEAAEGLAWDGEPPPRVAIGPDCAILGGPGFTPLSLPKGTSNFVVGRMQSENYGIDAYLVSLRLQPPVLRFDYWNPDCWRSYAANRVHRRKELAEIVEYLKGLDPKLPYIIGGDFNAPPDPWVFEPLAGIAQDAFRVRGRGYGATAVAGSPMVRICQIWYSIDNYVYDVRSESAPPSDHLATVATFYPISDKEVQKGLSE